MSIYFRNNTIVFNEICYKAKIVQDWSYVTVYDETPSWQSLYKQWQYIYVNWFAMIKYHFHSYEISQVNN